MMTLAAALEVLAIPTDPDRWRADHDRANATRSTDDLVKVIEAHRASRVLCDAAMLRAQIALARRPR